MSYAYTKGDKKKSTKHSGKTVGWEFFVIDWVGGGCESQIIVS